MLLRGMIISLKLSLPADDHGAEEFSRSQNMQEVPFRIGLGGVSGVSAVSGWYLAMKVMQTRSVSLLKSEQTELG